MKKHRDAERNNRGVLHFRDAAYYVSDYAKFYTLPMQVMIIMQSIRQPSYSKGIFPSETFSGLCSLTSDLAAEEVNVRKLLHFLGVSSQSHLFIVEQDPFLVVWMGGIRNVLPNESDIVPCVDA